VSHRPIPAGPRRARDLPAPRSASVVAADDARRRRLLRLMALSIAAAVTTIALKTGAWALTGSVGLLSDAAESVVNLVAAAFGFVAVVWAARPPDEDHAYGHEKANYLSAGVEGVLVLVAAVTIAIPAVMRLLDPQPIDRVGAGIAVSVLASGVNLVVALLLLRTGRSDDSLILEADGKHLLTDVWTSVGVVVGVLLVTLTGWDRLDPVVALLVAGNIVVAGTGILRRSTGGLMDRALEPDELRRIDDVLDGFASDDVRFHAVLTRRSGRRAFVSLHVLVPGDWTVHRGHDLVERVETALRGAFEQATVFTHLEPLDDPASFEDIGLDRDEEPRVGPPPAG
jgi:cation diffusion facilitator family transporter